MSEFFTADHHFGHARIIQHLQRPFSTVHQMNSALAELWNAKVGPDDQVWHLGDFTLQDVTRAREYFSHLNGRIHVLSNPWHHDRRWLESYKRFAPSDEEELYGD